MLRHTPLTALAALAALALATAAVAGCGPDRVQFQPTLGGGQGGGGAGGQTPVAVTPEGQTAHGTPPEQHQQLAQMLGQQGFQVYGAPLTGNLQPNGLIAYPINALAGQCFVVAAIGDEGRDINLVILDPYGRDIAHDVRPDAHPWGSFCASAPGRYIVRVQMTSGAGPYLYGAYVGRQRVSIAPFFGQEVEQGPQVATLDTATQQRLQSLDTQLSPDRFSRVGEPNGLVLAANQARNFPLTLAQGRCYAFAALGGPGVTDTDVTLVDGSGNSLESDASASADSLVRYCAPVAGSYGLQVRLAAGEGAVFTVGYVQAATGGVSSTPTEEPVIAAESTAEESVEDNFRLLDADMHARGYESMGDRSTGALNAGGAQDYQIQLEGGRCYAILAVGGGGVRNLDLRLLDGRGTELDRDVAEDARPIVRVCPQRSGSFTMQVRMSQGGGQYVYAPYRWPRGTTGPFGLEGLIYVRLAEVTSLLHVEGYEPDPNYALSRGTLRREGATGQHELSLEGGRCYSLLAVGGDGVHDLDLRLTAGGTEVATDLGSRNAFPSVRHCVEGNTTVSLEVRASSGQGPYLVQIFQRAEGQ